MICKFLGKNIKGKSSKRQWHPSAIRYPLVALAILHPSSILYPTKSRWAFFQHSVSVPSFQFPVSNVSALAAHLISTAFVTANILFARFVLRFLSLGVIWYFSEAAQLPPWPRCPIQESAQRPTPLRFALAFVCFN